jgi:hypothetical protein
MMGLTSQILATVVRAVPAVLPHLSEDAIKALGQASYEGVRATYWLAIYDAIYGYLSGEGRVTAFRASAQRAMVEAFGSATDAAYVEGGGELPLDDDTLAWFNGRVSQEMGFIDQLFDGLREKRGDVSAEAEAEARAEAYSRTLDGIYGEAMMRGSKNVMLTWHLGATEKHCKTCAQLDGKSHRISWFIDHDYIPRKPGASMECGGWNCDCSLTDKNGNEYTV